MILKKLNPSASRFLGSAIVLGLTWLCCCHSVRHNQLIKSVALSVNYPIVTITPAGVFSNNLKDTIKLYYYKDLILYRLSESRILETEELIPGTENYFIRKRKADSGFLFISLSDTTSRKLPADSILINGAYQGASVELSSNFTPVNLVKEGKDRFHEEYSMNASNNENLPDSIYLYYSKELKKVDYTFSRKLDSLKGMKLYKFRLLYNEKVLRVTNQTIPKREFLFEIRTQGEPTPKPIMEFIKRFEATQKH
jgi:hypothetical protein